MSLKAFIAVGFTATGIKLPAPLEKDGKARFSRKDAHRQATDLLNQQGVLHAEVFQSVVAVNHSDTQ